MGESNSEVIGKNVAVPNSPAGRVWLKTLLSYTLGFLCLVWVFHDYDFTDLLRRVVVMNPYWVLAAIVCDFLSYVCQGVRWRLLLHSFASISVLETTQAIYSGMFVNEVLPLKLGELLRAYLITRWSAVRLGTVATSIVIERLFDGFWILAGFTVTMIFIPLPHRLIEAGDALSALVLTLTGLLIALSFRKENGKPFHWNLARSFGRLLDRTAVDLRTILYSPSSLLAFALSLVVVSLQWFAFWLVMVGYGLHLSPLAAAAVFLIVHVGSSLPGAPGNIGTYQFFTVLGLTLFGVDKESATGFSVVVFVLLSAHILILGFWALRRSGLTLLGAQTGLRRALKRMSEGRTLE